METITEQEHEADVIAGTESAAMERELTRDMSRLQRKLSALEREVVELRRAVAESVGDEAWSAVARYEDLLDDVQAAQADIYRMVAHAMSFRHSPSEVEHWCKRAVEMGASHPQLSQSLIGNLIRHRMVPNVAFRRRLEERLDGVSLTEIALRVCQQLRVMEEEHDADYGSGTFVRMDDGELKGVSTYVERQLGIKSKSGNRGYKPTVRIFLTYEQAVAFARVLDMSPIEAGV